VLTLATPAWLFAWLFVPAIRWLHRSGPPRRRVPVPSLAPWPRTERVGPAAGVRRPPDPAWRRRALLVALLAAALAGPGWIARPDRVTLWIDDARSILTREGASTRLDAGLALAARALADDGAAVEVRTLCTPWRAWRELGTDAASAIAAGAAEHDACAPPPAALRGTNARHWLLTDGARELPGLDSYERVLRVGSATRNAGIVRLAARRSLGTPGHADVEIEVRTGGAVDERRTLVLDDGERRIATFPLQLPPGAAKTLRTSVPLPESLRAHLDPADALVADDALALPSGALPALQAVVDPACAAVLRDAIHAHPALRAGEGAPAIAFTCGGRETRPGEYHVRFAAGTDAAVVETLAWSPAAAAASRRRVTAESVRVRGRLAPDVGDRVLLSAHGAPVVVQPTTGTIDVALFPGSGDAAAPLLIAFLADAAAGRPLLDAPAVVRRAAGSVAIAPRATGGSAPAAAPGPSTARRVDLARVPLALASLLLLVELVLLARRAAAAPAAAAGPT
jgi:hypothetical protein